MTTRINARFAKTATERADIARNAHVDTRTRELLWAGIGARMWPSFVAPTPDLRDGSKDDLFPAVLCIDSPAGRLSYRLSKDEIDAFAHVPSRDTYDGLPCTQIDKMGRLLDLCMEGWE